MRFILILVFFGALVEAKDPLSSELDACEGYCKSLDKDMLGIRRAPFGQSFYRACVCKDERVASPIKARPATTVTQPKANRAANSLENSAILPDSLDCESPAVQACLARPTRMNIPVNGLPSTTPPSGLFNVTIVEVTDYQCPFCRRVQSTLEQIKSEQGIDIRFVFLHNPLAFHARALPAAKAAQAAHRQNQFWAYNHLLFSRPSDFSDAHFIALAEEVGLDINRFKRDYADPELANEVAKQKELAISRGARGTPSFFINGRPLRGAQPISQFLKEIRMARAEAIRLRQRGLTDSEMIYQTLIKDGLKEVPAPQR